MVHYGRSTNNTSGSAIMWGNSNLRHVVNMVIGGPYSLSGSRSFNWHYLVCSPFLNLGPSLSYGFGLIVDMSILSEKEEFTLILEHGLEEERPGGFRVETPRHVWTGSSTVTGTGTTTSDTTILWPPAARGVTVTSRGPSPLSTTQVTGFVSPIWVASRPTGGSGQSSSSRNFFHVVRGKVRQRYGEERTVRVSVCRKISTLRLFWNNEQMEVKWHNWTLSLLFRAWRKD